jgi:arginine deiminase
MIDKIFDNFEILYENYMDMPETQKERNNIFKHMEEKGIDIIEIEQDISTLNSEYERQGFLYGFRYAISLFLDGTLRYE